MWQAFICPGSWDALGCPVGDNKKKKELPTYKNFCVRLQAEARQLLLLLIRGRDGHSILRTDTDGELLGRCRNARDRFEPGPEMCDGPGRVHSSFRLRICRFDQEWNVGNGAESVRG